MSRRLHLRNRRTFTSRWPWADDRASQIVEFALSLPLLVLFVVGIFDFSGAISLKQKLTNAAREAARVAAADPANDLSGTSLPMPVSVNDAVQVVDNYLVSEKINDCQLTGAAPTPGGGLTWSFNANPQTNGCPAPGITLTINRRRDRLQRWELVSSFNIHTNGNSPVCRDYWADVSLARAS